MRKSRKLLAAPSTSQSFSAGSTLSPANPNLHSTPLAVEENLQTECAVVQPDPIGPCAHRSTARRAHRRPEVAMRGCKAPLAAPFRHGTAPLDGNLPPG